MKLYTFLQACLHQIPTFSRMTCLWHHPKYLLASILLLQPSTAYQETHGCPTYQMLRLIISGSFLFPVRDSPALGATLGPWNPLEPHALREVCEAEWKSQTLPSLACRFPRWSFIPLDCTVLCLSLFSWSLCLLLWGRVRWHKTHTDPVWRSQHLVWNT